MKDRDLAGPWDLGLRRSPPARDLEPQVGMVRKTRRGVRLDGPVRFVSLRVAPVLDAREAHAGGSVLRRSALEELRRGQRPVAQQVEHDFPATQPDRVRTVLKRSKERGPSDEKDVARGHEVEGRSRVHRSPDAGPGTVSGFEENPRERHGRRVGIPELDEFQSIVRTRGVVEDLVQEKLRARARRKERDEERNGDQDRGRERARHEIPLGCEARGRDAKRGGSRGLGAGRPIRGASGPTSRPTANGTSFAGPIPRWRPGSAGRRPTRYGRGPAPRSSPWRLRASEASPSPAPAAPGERPTRPSGKPSGPAWTDPR